MESVPSSICRACRLRLQLKKPSTTTSRAFATSSTRLYIPPESPAFIDVPQQHQPTPERNAPTKGLLPVPREIFPRNRPDKPGPQYIKNVTNDPKPKNIPPPELQSEKMKFKLRMAEMRKSHLREGLAQLYARKTAFEKRIGDRAIARREEHDRLIAQAEREDERLTNSSISSDLKQAADPHSQFKEQEDEIYEQRKARHDAIQRAKHEARLDKLHTLYMHARSFITNKEQLQAAIDTEFDKTGSIWTWARGPPSTLGEMRASHPGSSRMDAGTATGTVPDNAPVSRDQERMKRIAEKLSGGKM